MLHRHLLLLLRSISGETTAYNRLEEMPLADSPGGARWPLLVNVTRKHAKLVSEVDWIQAKQRIGGGFVRLEHVAVAQAGSRRLEIVGVGNPGAWRGSRKNRNSKLKKIEI